MKLSEFLSNRNNSGYAQFFRYAISGSVAFIVDFLSLYIFTDYLNIYYLVSAGIAFLLGALVMYLFSITWVFDKRRFHNKQLEVILFILISFVGLILTEFFIWFFTDKISFHYLFSKIISATIVVLWNFFSKKIILFTSKY